MDLKNKILPFTAIVRKDYLDAYDWEHGDRLIITELLDDLDAEHNEYLWMAENIDKDSFGAVATYQIIF